MEILRWKTRISVLWIWMAVAAAAHSLLFLFEPGGIEQVTSGELQWGPWMMFFDALFWLVPLLMAVLSLSLKDTANRQSNLILGTIFTVLNLGHFIRAVSYFGLSVHQILVVGSSVIVAALIFWYALKWPRLAA